MYQSNQGHGIAGAKNIYSSKVKLGNWVEDSFGKLLTENPREPIKIYETNTMRSHPHPETWPEPPNMPINMLSTQELKAKNKEGLSYSLLFDHGVKEFPADERFKTTAMLSIGSQSSNTFALPDKSLERQKAKQMTEDIKLATIKTTEVRQSYGNLSFTPGSSGRLVGATEELPNFRRKNPIAHFPGSSDQLPSQIDDLPTDFRRKILITQGPSR